jgi:hypothetical protein
MRLKVQLSESWSPVENPHGPATFVRHASASPGALQVSWAESDGVSPPPTYADLVQMACEFGEANRLGDVVETLAGSCGFGAMGTAAFRSPGHARVQVWFMCDGRHFINATHVCEREPEPAEVEEAVGILSGLSLSSD